MSVFLCWSGDRSHALGHALKALLVGSLPSLRKDDVFISDSIEKGANWFNSLERELDRARVGVVCLTAENLTSAWLHFEAGALGTRLALLSKSHEGGAQPSEGAAPPRRLFTVLHGLAGSQLAGPLSAYQFTLTTEEDIGEMVLSLARALGLREATARRKTGSIVPKRRWTTFKRTLDKLSVPARKIVSIDVLFDRKTFNEPIHHCTDQAWVRRCDGVRETLTALLDHEDRVEAACSQHERAVFNMLLAELNGYAMAMQSLLLRPRKFALTDPGELNIDPAIRTCCEDRRLAIKSLATLLLHPLDEPLREEAVRFMGAETNAERKMIVHRLEGTIRWHRERVFEEAKQRPFRAGALNQALDVLTSGRSPVAYRASSWDLDRIYYYLLVQYFTTWALRWDSSRVGGMRRRDVDAQRAPPQAMEHDWLCAARDIEMEVERYRAKSKGGSLMPLTYALCALRELHPERAAHLVQVTGTVQSALDVVERETGGALPSDAARTVQQLVANLRPPGRRAGRWRSGDANEPTAAAGGESPAARSPTRRTGRPTASRPIRQPHARGH